MSIPEGGPIYVIRVVYADCELERTAGSAACTRASMLGLQAQSVSRCVEVQWKLVCATSLSKFQTYHCIQQSIETLVQQ